jgi:hypothetical protein
VIDQETGVAISNGGYVNEGYEIRPIKGLPFPETVRAATFDIQDPLQPILVGGAPSLPSDSQIFSDYVEYATLSGAEILGNASEEDSARLEELGGPPDLPLAIDSIRIRPVVELEDGVERKRLYVANGSGGVARLNLDEQNGLQHLSSVLSEEESLHVGDVLKLGHALYAARGPGPGGDIPREPCKRTSGKPISSGSIEQINYLDPEDPVYLGKMPEMFGGNVILNKDEWGYSAGKRNGWNWNTGGLCMLFRSNTADRSKDSETGTVTAVNLFDPLLTRQFSFNGNVLDLAVYGDYLIAALGSGGVDIVHMERPDEMRTNFKIEYPLQSNRGRAVRLKLFGNLLFVSAANGSVIVLDIAEPLAPYVISAGNKEMVETADVYKERLVTGAGTLGLRLLQLPEAFVASSSIAEGGLIAENEFLRLTFNEEITELSLQQPDAVTVTKLDSGETVPVTVTAVDPLEGHSSQFDLSFERQDGVRYQVQVNDARNLRGQGLWRRFVQRLKAAESGALRPQIAEVEYGAFHRGSNQAQIIRGSGFRNDPALKLFVDQYEVTPEWIDENTLRIPAGALEQLPLESGQHHLRVVDSSLTASMPGAIFLGDDPENTSFKLSQESGNVKGGTRMRVTASDDVFLPGAKVIMRSRRGDEIRTIEVSPGIYVSDMKDDVSTVTEFRFRLPGVPVPDLYDVYIETGGQELFIGNFSI